MKHELFRKEVVQAHGQRLDGDVRLSADLAPWVVTGLLIAIAATAISLLILGEYPRRETVTGRLLPEGGMVEMKPDRAGRVLEIHAAERDLVLAGAPLLTIGRDLTLVGGVKANGQLLHQLREERTQLENRLALVDDRTEERSALLQTRRAGLIEERDALDEQAAAMEHRVTLVGQQLEAISSLAARGTASKMQELEQKDRYFSTVEASASLHAAKSRIRRAIAEAEAEMSALSVEAATQRAELKERIATLDQRQTEAELSGRAVISAPYNGIVGAVLSHVGDDIDAGATVMTFVPEGALLQAEVLVPSRAAGFLSPGQPVRVRYDAFPHQTFGVAKGKVASVSKTAVLPRRLTLESAPSEPVFRVVANLEKQSVKAYGKDMPLQPGMTLSADLVLETRSLLSLLLDPVRAAVTR